MIHLAYARVADLINAEDITCYVGDPPENCPVPFCFVWGPLPTEEAKTLSRTVESVDEEFHIQVVAKQAPDVFNLAATVKAILRNQELPISGWRTFPLKIYGSTNVQTVRGVVNEASNTYPAWLTLHIRLRATKE